MVLYSHLKIEVAFPRMKYKLMTIDPIYMGYRSLSNTQQTTFCGFLLNKYDKDPI